MSKISFIAAILLGTVSPAMHASPLTQAEFPRLILPMQNKANDPSHCADFSGKWAGHCKEVVNLGSGDETWEYDHSTSIIQNECITVSMGEKSFFGNVQFNLGGSSSLTNTTSKEQLTTIVLSDWSGERDAIVSSFHISQRSIGNEIPYMLHYQGNMNMHLEDDVLKTDIREEMTGSGGPSQKVTLKFSCSYKKFAR